MNTVSKSLKSANMQFQCIIVGRWHNRSVRSVVIAVLTVMFIIVSSLTPPTKSITITTVYAGKKKFKSFNLGIPFLPTLVKVKPNKLSLSFRKSRYIRPPKFKIEGSIPLKVPTILIKKPDPYEYENMEVININKDIKLGREYDQGNYASSTDQEPVKAPLKESQSENVSYENQQPTKVIESMSSESIVLPPSSPPLLPFTVVPFDSTGNPPVPMMPPLLPLMFENTIPMPSMQLYGTAKSEQLPNDYLEASRVHSRIKRSLNINEPYHHHLNRIPNSPSTTPILPTSPETMKSFLRPSRFPYGFFPQIHPAHSSFVLSPSNIYIPYPSMFRRPFPYQFGPVAKQDNPSETPQLMLLPDANIAQIQSLQLNTQASKEPAIVSGKKENQQRSLLPMKINIGEHYNPNIVYMDENIMPNLEDISVIDSINGNNIEEPISMESSYNQKNYKELSKPKDSGPDDFRISFSVSGVHGGKLVPLGTGDNIEQFYRQLKKFKGNNMPVGLPPDQLYKYYKAHTFTNGIKVYKMTSAKVIKAKLLKALFG